MIDPTAREGAKCHFREACCTSLEAVQAAWRTGARRIELCERLDVGGVTPSDTLLQEVLDWTRQAPIPEDGGSPLPVHVLVRPRGGNFVYDASEVNAMLESIARSRALGARGVVIGALTPEGAVDLPVMHRLMAAAEGLSVTFHRAFDETADPMAALEDVIALGCTRLLTSGHAPDAYTGREMIGTLVSRSAGRLVILAGCGVRPGNITAIAHDSGAPEFHSSCISPDWP